MLTCKSALFRGILAIGALLAVAAPAAAATPIPNGKWSFVWTDAKGRPDRPIRVYTYRPRACDTKCPIVFVMHGVKREASVAREQWELIADNHKVLLVVPEFTRERWPRAAAYNLGDVAEQADREKWAFSAIERLFDEVRDGQPDYVIYGHSAGAQFVANMALFRPDNRARVMVAAAPGWFTMPEWRKDKGAQDYPYSLLGSKAGEAEVRQALAKRLLVLASAKDASPDEDKLDTSSAATKQGEGRIDRAENFIKAGNAAAADLGVKLAWELHEVPDNAADAQAMAKLGAQNALGK